MTKRKEHSVPRQGGDHTKRDYDIEARYLMEINRYPLLSAEDERSIAKGVAEGDDSAKRKLILSNLRLVVTISKRYLGQGLGFLDLVEEGNLGLIKAVGKFDYTKGYRFSTYASWWIKQSITRAIANQSRAIRIPIHIYQLVNRYLKLDEQKGEKHLSDSDMAASLGVSVKKIRMIRRLIQGIRTEELSMTAEALHTLASDYPRETIATPEEMVTVQMENERIAEMMGRHLSDREQAILKTRYGLEDGTPKTLAETGKMMGVSRERIRQIEKRALQKLKIMLFGGSKKT